MASEKRNQKLLWEECLGCVSAPDKLSIDKSKMTGTELKQRACFVQDQSVVLCSIELGLVEV